MSRAAAALLVLAWHSEGVNHTGWVQMCPSKGVYTFGQDVGPTCSDGFEQYECGGVCQGLGNATFCKGSGLAPCKGCCPAGYECCVGVCVSGKGQCCKSSDGWDTTYSFCPEQGQMCGSGFCRDSRDSRYSLATGAVVLLVCTVVYLAARRVPGGMAAKEERTVQQEEGRAILPPAEKHRGGGPYGAGFVGAAFLLAAYLFLIPLALRLSGAVPTYCQREITSVDDTPTTPATTSHAVSLAAWLVPGLVGGLALALLSAFLAYHYCTRHPDVWFVQVRMQTASFYLIPVLGYASLYGVIALDGCYSTSLGLHAMLPVLAGVEFLWMVLSLSGTKLSGCALVCVGLLLLLPGIVQFAFVLVAVMNTSGMSVLLIILAVLAAKLLFVQTYVSIREGEGLVVKYAAWLPICFQRYAYEVKDGELLLQDSQLGSVASYGAVTVATTTTTTGLGQRTQSFMGWVVFGFRLLHTVTFVAVCVALRGYVVHDDDNGSSDF